MPKQTNSGNDLLRYAGLGGQILVSLGLAVFVGYRADKWLTISFPLLVWLLPLVVVGAMIYKLIKETGKKNGAEK